MRRLGTILLWLCQCQAFQPFHPRTFRVPDTDREIGKQILGFFDKRDEYFSGKISTLTLQSNIKSLLCKGNEAHENEMKMDFIYNDSDFPRCLIFSFENRTFVHFVDFKYNNLFTNIRCWPKRVNFIGDGDGGEFMIHEGYYKNYQLFYEKEKVGLKDTLSRFYPNGWSNIEIFLSGEGDAGALAQLCGVKLSYYCEKVMVVTKNTKHSFFILPKLQRNIQLFNFHVMPLPLPSPFPNLYKRIGLDS